MEEIQSFDDSDSATSDALKEILTFKIQSQFFESDSGELEIDKVDLISFTESDFEIQLVFKNTDYISASATEPDIIEVRFKKNDLFVDAETYEVVDPGFVMYVRLPP